MMTNIAIIGFGGHAHVLKDLLSDLPGYRFRGFIGKNSDSSTEFREDQLSKLKENNISCLANGIGNISYEWAEKMIEKYLKEGFKFPPICHKSAIIAKSAIIGEGSVALENAVVKSNSIVGKFCILNSLSLVSHDCTVEDFVHISLGAKIGGKCSIAKNSFLGINSSVNPERKIGSNVIVGAGSVVLSDIPDHVVVAGNPAKIIKTRQLPCL